MRQAEEDASLEDGMEDEDQEVLEDLEYEEQEEQKEVEKVRVYDTVQEEVDSREDLDSVPFWVQRDGNICYC